ncbi:MAG: hypothetical protein ACI9UV_003214, partial [Algoriphagus sp.]
QIFKTLKVKSLFFGYTIDYEDKTKYYSES